MWKFGAAISLLALAACAPSDSTVLLPATYADLPGWQDDKQAESLKLFADSCRAVETHGGYKAGNGETIGDPAAWQQACRFASQLAGPSNSAARQFFETYFKPYQVTTAHDSFGHLTGYYEPELKGSMTRHGSYQVPVYGLPRDLPMNGQPYFTRAEIEMGALEGRAPVLLYVDDPVMLFFLQVQGSGKVTLDDGKVVSLQYAGRNNQPYVAISGVLKQSGELQQVSLDSIRSWLNAHPERIRQVLDWNPCYIFFKLAPGAQAAKGGLGLPLTPGRSVAIDANRAAYGVPIYIVTSASNYFTKSDDPFDQLMVASDTGSALVGPHRIDIFFGRGQAAEWQAGHQNTHGLVYWLLPQRQGF